MCNNIKCRLLSLCITILIIFTQRAARGPARVASCDRGATATPPARAARLMPILDTHHNLATLGHLAKC